MSPVVIFLFIVIPSYLAGVMVGVFVDVIWSQYRKKGGCT